MAATSTAINDLLSTPTVSPNKNAELQKQTTVHYNPYVFTENNVKFTLQDPKKVAQQDVNCWRHTTKHRMVTSPVTIAMGEQNQSSIAVTSVVAPNFENPRDCRMFLIPNDNNALLNFGIVKYGNGFEGRHLGTAYKDLLKLTYLRFFYAQHEYGVELCIIPPFIDLIGTSLNKLTPSDKIFAFQANYCALTEALEALTEFQELYPNSALKEVWWSLPLPSDLLEEAQKMLAHSEGALRQSESKIQQSESAIQQSESAIQQARSALQQVEAAIQQAGAAIQQAEAAAIQQVEAAIQQVEAAIQQAGAATQQAGAATQQAKSATQQAKSATQEAKSIIQQAEVALQQAKSIIQQAKAAVEEISRYRGNIRIFLKYEEPLNLAQQAAKENNNVGLLNPSQDIGIGCKSPTVSKVEQQLIKQSNLVTVQTLTESMQILPFPSPLRSIPAEGNVGSLKTNEELFRDFMCSDLKDDKDTSILVRIIERWLKKEYPPEHDVSKRVTIINTNFWLGKNILLKKINFFHPKDKERFINLTQQFLRPPNDGLEFPAEDLQGLYSLREFLLNNKNLKKYFSEIAFTFNEKERLELQNAIKAWLEQNIEQDAKVYGEISITIDDDGYYGEITFANLKDKSHFIRYCTPILWQKNFDALNSNLVVELTGEEFIILQHYLMIGRCPEVITLSLQSNLQQEQEEKTYQESDAKKQNNSVDPSTISTTVPTIILSSQQDQNISLTQALLLILFSANENYRKAHFGNDRLSHDHSEKGKQRSEDVANIIKEALPANKTEEALKKVISLILSSGTTDNSLSFYVVSALQNNKPLVEHIDQSFGTRLDRLSELSPPFKNTKRRNTVVSFLQELSNLKNTEINSSELKLGDTDASSLLLNKK